MAKIKPLGENIVIEPVKVAQKTESGFYLPDNASQDRPKQGKVVAVGDSKKIVVKKGQTVIYKGYYSDDDAIKEGKKEYLVVKNEDVVAVME